MPPDDIPSPLGVLVVDDEPMVARAVALALEAHGLRAFTATSGAAAVAVLLARRGEIGVALIDGRMPGMGGEETALALRGVEPNLPCCLMTGYAGECTPRPGPPVWSMTLAKPFRIAEAARAARELLARGLTAAGGDLRKGDGGERHRS